MTDTIYQLRIELLDIRPPIWRQVMVSPKRSLDELHEMIQAVMGWGNSHMHQFIEIKTNTFYANPRCGMEDTRSTVATKISDLLPKEKSIIGYEYDFGDSWRHLITLQKILPMEADMSEPYCTGGKRACPPDDCGGWPGYENLCAIMQDKKHKEHKSMLEWLGLRNAKEFDPEAFNPLQINADLKPFRRKTKAKKKAA